MFKYLIISIISLNTLLSQQCLGGELRTIDSYIFGRFEVRMKPAFGDGYVSSFFTYHDFWESFYGNWATFINEIDIEFTGNLENSVQFTTHHPGPWSLTEIQDTPFNPFDEYHDYAFEWTPDYVKWFINDIEVYSQEGMNVIDLIYPQKIMMNIWAAIYEDWVGEWNTDTMPVYSYYDHVKYYYFTEGEGNYGTNNNFTLEWEENFNSYNQNRWQEATHGFDGNLCQFSPVNVFIHSGKLVLQATSTDYLLGDVSYDSIINVVDIIELVNIILSFSEPINTSDVNQDNYINIIDVVSIVEIILSD